MSPNLFTMRILSHPSCIFAGVCDGPDPLLVPRMHAVVVAGLWASQSPACACVSAWPHRTYLAVLLHAYRREMYSPTNDIGDSY
jgi:hypothetical protein